jgi:putative polyhydroxyalkanoate system protein
MASIHVERNHTLGIDSARERVETIARHLEQKLSIDHRWKGDTLHFSRAGATGSIDVRDDRIVLDVKLGLALGLMKGTIEETIHEELDRALGDSAIT